MFVTKVIYSFLYAYTDREAKDVIAAANNKSNKVFDLLQLCYVWLFNKDLTWLDTKI